MNLRVDSEIGRLRKLIIHSPDSGLGKVVPSKAQDWLFEDIVHLETMRKHEYDIYVQVLLYFLDYQKIHQASKSSIEDRSFFKPLNPNYFDSNNVIEFEKLLLEVLNNDGVKVKLIAAVCALEECSYRDLQKFLTLSNRELVSTLISGIMPDGTMIFPPVPNLIFTRDIGITINDHLLLNKPAKLARSREALLAKYIFFNHSFFRENENKIIEVEENDFLFLLPENEQENRSETLEGGDVMMVAPNHLLIGISERTSVSAAKQVIDKLFKKDILEKVSLIKIPAKRDYMHIDTVFTQIRRDVWVVLGSIARSAEVAQKYHIWEELGQKPHAEELIIHQFRKGQEPVKYDNLEDLLTSISTEDLGYTGEVKFVYSGDNEFPYGAREQWTDSCNLLVVKEGVAIGYDRNDKTSRAFEKIGFRTVRAQELISNFKMEKEHPDDVENTIILLPSAELSRARGGSHCMSMPIIRDSVVS